MTKPRIIEPGHLDYPKCLEWAERQSKPIFLWGAPIWRTHELVGVIGSREPSHDATRWMEMHLAPALNGHQHCVVSGGARGVDQKAHQLSVMNGVPTLCLLPSGFGCIYPSSLSPWVEFIVNGGGGLISLWPETTPMQKSHFHIRNRYLAAISSLLIVIEARRRSGTMLTADFAAQIGRPLATLPISPLMTAGQGNLDLLANGAQLLRDSQDLRQWIDLNPRGGARRPSLSR